MGNGTVRQESIQAQDHSMMKLSAQELCLKRRNGKPDTFLTNHLLLLMPWGTSMMAKNQREANGFSVARSIWIVQLAWHLQVFLLLLLCLLFDLYKRWII